MRTTIDEDAPVTARRTAEVAAPLNIVWGVHLRVAEWPEWQPDIQGLVSDAPVLTAGGWFTWSSAGLEIRSDVQRVDDDAHETFWGGPAGGILGLHRWRFAAAGPGLTRVLTEESWSGAPVEADPSAARQALDDSLARWLERMTARAESLR